ncbi:peptidase M23 [Enterococcus sp. JM4C]|uniref:aggregation-promoting factor n=1 Tax=Candidatus Enterococcus huntleyi TaxID=1857217 RepID=UPI00137AC896|nr:LysM peptidoglycan-binding domain-containing protein [Enterococcus sp. JM4C]KAF1295571.1 peptidase M23 [Enterococcus sp. JM4C]
MKSLKTLLLGATLAAGATVLLGTTDAFADTSYTVQSGDTLSTISAKYSDDSNFIHSIAEKNQISNLNLIITGQELIIPTDNGEVLEATAPAEETYVEADPAQETYTEAAPVEQAAPASSSSAKEWIAQKESGGSYSATNGRYIGRYQLDSSYLNGDYSAENQERVADNYVTQRYGSWENAQAFWLSNGWY